MSFIPVVGPLISCIVDGTFVDMWNAIQSGDWAMLAMCAMAFVPGGKALKGLKGISAMADISKAAKAKALGKLALNKGEKTFKFSQSSARHAAGKHFDEIAKRGRTGGLDDTVTFVNREWSSAAKIGPACNPAYTKFESEKLRFIIDEGESTIATIFPY